MRAFAAFPRFLQKAPCARLFRGCDGHTLPAPAPRLRRALARGGSRLPEGATQGARRGCITTAHIHLAHLVDAARSLEQGSIFLETVVFAFVMVVVVMVIALEADTQGYSLETRLTAWGTSVDSPQPQKPALVGFASAYPTATM